MAGNGNAARSFARCADAGALLRGYKRGEHAPRNLAGITCQRDVLAFRRDIRGYPCDQIFARRLILRRRY